MDKNFERETGMDENQLNESMHCSRDGRSKRRAGMEPFSQL